MQGSLGFSLHAICQSMNYSGGRSEVFFSISATNPKPLLCLLAFKLIPGARWEEILWKLASTRHCNAKNLKLKKLSLLSSFRQVSIHKAFIINSVTTGGAVCCTSHWWRTMYHLFSLEKGCSLSVCCSIAWSICSLQPYRSSLPGLINNSQQWKQQTTCEKWGMLIASHFSQFGLGLTFFLNLYSESTSNWLTRRSCWCGCSLLKQMARKVKCKNSSSTNNAYQLKNSNLFASFKNFYV